MVLRRIVLAACLVIAHVDAADACSCMGGIPACQSVWMHDAVFEGTVVSIEAEPNADAVGGLAWGKLVRLKDVRAWVGEPADIVLTGNDDGDCGYKFAVGVRYVIVAHRGRNDRRYGTSICSGTKPLAEAGALVAYLETLSKPSAGASVFGTINVRPSPFLRSSDARAPEPLPGARLILRGPVERTTTSGPDGRYSFESLPPGEYLVSVETPGDRPELAPIAPQQVKLPNAYACASPWLGTEVNGVIEGVVRDEAGKPVHNAMMNIRSASSNERPYYQTAVTDEAGHFQFKGLPPDSYVVGLNLWSGPTKASPYAVAIVPFSTTDTQFELAPGERRVLAPVVAKRLETIRVQGVASWPDGRPAIGAIVSAAPFGESVGFSYQGGGKTDTSGQFSFDGFKGVRYRLMVTENQIGRGTIDFVAADQPIVITLQPFKE